MKNSESTHGFSQSQLTFIKIKKAYNFGNYNLWVARLFYLEEEEEMQGELSQIVNDLKENPMLGLSQAGNELVHSNLLAWILECNNDQVISQNLNPMPSIITTIDIIRFLINLLYSFFI